MLPNARLAVQAEPGPPRHHIPKQKRKVTNSVTYDAALCQRGSLTVWFTDEAIAAWTAERRTIQFWSTTIKNPDLQRRLTDDVVEGTFTCSTL